MGIRVLIALCLFAANGPAGLGQTRPENPSPQADTAGAASAAECAEIFFTSLLNGDQQLNEQVSLVPSHLDRVALRTLIRFAGAADKFRTQFVKAYGKDAWERMNDPNHLPHDKNASSGANGSVTVMERQLIPGLVSEAKDNATESRSSLRVPNADHSLQLVRIEGRWFVQAETLTNLRDPEEVRKMTNLLGSIAVQLERYIHVIGKPGVTPDDIDFQIGVTSLRAMEMPGADRIADRVNPEGLPEAKPFTPIGDLDLLPQVDEASLNRAARAAVLLLKDFLNGNEADYVARLAPPIRPFVDPKSIRALSDRVRQRWPGIAQFEPMAEDVNWDFAAGCRVQGRLGDGDDAPQFEIFGLADTCVGLTISAADFGVDTRELKGSVDDLSARHAELMQAVVNGDMKKVYVAMYPDRQAVGQEYEDFAADAYEGLEWLKNTPLCARAGVSENRPMVTVYSHCDVKVSGQTKYEMCLSEFLANSDGKGWELWRYHTGNLDQSFIMNDCDAAESFIRALAGQDEKTCFQCMAPPMRDIVQTSVFKAFAEEVHEHYGDFQSVDRLHQLTRASFLENSRGIDTNMTMHCSKRSLPVRTRYLYGGLFSFQLLDDVDIGQFPRRIKDTTELDQTAQRFLSAVIGGTFADMGSLMHEGLREQAGDLQKFDEGTTEFRKRIGEMKKIELAGTEYQEEDEELKLLYKVECEHEPLEGHVTFSFNPLRGEVVNFNVSVEEEEAEPETP